MSFQIRILFLFLLIPILTYSEGFFSNLVYYSPKEYRAQTQNRAVIQDSLGIMYFGNASGLLIFNGSDWRLEKLPNKSGVTCFAKAFNGTIFLGAQGDFGFLLKDNLGNQKFHSLLFLLEEKYRNFEGVLGLMAEGNFVYVLTQKNVFCYDLIHQKLHVVSNSIFSAIASNSNFTVAFDNFNGILIMQKGKLIEKIPILNINIEKISFVNQSSLLIFSKNFVIYEFSLTDKKVIISSDYSVLSQFLNGKILLDVISKGDLLYISTREDGLFVYSKKDLTITKMIDGFEVHNEPILGLGIDQLGNFWLAQEVGISYLQRNAHYKYISEYSGLRGLILSFAVFENYLFIGTTYGLFKSDKPYGFSFLNSSTHFKMLPKTEGEVWALNTIDNQLFCSHKNGLMLYENNQLKQITSGSMVWGVKKIPKTSFLLAGTYNLGFLILEKKNQNWKLRNELKGFGLSSRYFICNEPKTIWVSHPYKGVFKLNLDKDLRFITQQKEYSSNSGGLKDRTYNFIYQIEKEIVVSSETDLFQYEASKDKFIKSSLFTNVALQGSVRKLLYNGLDTYWFQAGDEQIGGLLRNRDLTLKMIDLPLLEEFQGSQVYSLMYKFPYFFMGLSDGFVVLDTKTAFNIDNSKETTYHTLISKLTYGEKDSILAFNINETSDLKFNIPYSDNSLKIFFAQTNYDSKIKSKFSYKLEGFESKWSDWSSKSNKEYFNLQPGVYTFYIRSKSLGSTDYPETKFVIKISSPWFLTFWAMLVYVLLFISFMALVVRIYNLFLLREQKKLQKEISIAVEKLNSQKLDLEKVNYSLLQLNEEKNFLMGILAHDLRSPINQVKGYLNLIKLSKESLNLSVLSYLNGMENVLHKITEMISKILDAKSIESGNLNSVQEQFDLKELIIDVIERYSLETTRKNITLESNLGAIPILINKDKNFITQILDNLISNAIKYTDFDKKVFIQLVVENGLVKVLIIDQGPGFTEEDKKRMYGKYARLSALPTGGESSTGLGLSIVKKFVELTDGKLNCETAKGRGSKFTLEYQV